MIRLIALLTLLALPARAEIAIQDVTSPGGLRAWLVQENSIPFSVIEIIFRGGANIETEENAGVVSLMTGLLSEGAGDMDALALAERVETLAAGISFDAGRDSVSLTIRALSENIDEVIDLARIVLTEPRFDPDAVERNRAQALASIARSERNPNAMAARAFAEAGFGDHAYGRPTSGNAETVAALSIADLRAAHAGTFARDRIYIGAAGDMDADRLGVILDRLLGDLPATGAPVADATEFAAAPGITVIEHPGPQSVILFGHAGVARDDPDFMAAFALNEIVGGGRFGTRMMRELREERGLTYGAGTGLASGDLAHSLRGQFSTDNARVPEALEVLRDLWTRLAQEGISADELDRVQTYLTGAYPLRFDGNGSIAGIMASMQFQGFPIDYVNIRNDLVRAVTLDQINAMAARLYQSEALFVVVVGQPQGLE